MLLCFSASEKWLNIKWEHKTNKDRMIIYLFIQINV